MAVFSLLSFLIGGAIAIVMCLIAFIWDCIDDYNRWR